MLAMEFTIGSCVRFGWDTFKKRPWFLLGATVLYFLGSVVVSMIDNVILTALKEAMPSAAATGINFITSTLIGAPLSLWFITFALKAHDNPEGVRIADAFGSMNVFWSFVGATFLVFIVVCGGFVLFIIPGFIFGLMYGFATYLVADRRLGVLDAMKESRRITKGHRWKLFGLGLVLLLLGILGTLCLFVGILVAFPVIVLAFAHAYRVLETNGNTLESTTPASL
jgi:uncharacterized membrane protein